MAGYIVYCSGLIILYLVMSNHSNKYYHLIKALRIQKQQSETSKILRERMSAKRYLLESQRLSPERIADNIDLDNSLEMDEKDRKYEVAFAHNENEHVQFSSLWNRFKKQSLTLKLTDQVMPIHKKISQAKDQKLIDVILEEYGAEKGLRQFKIIQLSNEMKEQEEEQTLLKEKAIELGLELEGYEKELVDLKANFDKEEKKINERSSKYKQERSKDIMIKNIDRQDMEMRKAMASRIKLNQELDFGFQIQRRRAFNQAKQSINEKKKISLDKLNRLKLLIAEHQKTQDQIQLKKAELKKTMQASQKEAIYFVKNVLKFFKNHSRGVQWLIRLLKEWNTQVRLQDFPQDISKEDAQFMAKLLNEVKIHESESTKKPCPLNATSKSNFKVKMNQRFKTQPNININEQVVRNKSSLEKKKLQHKTTVYFDIQNQDDSSFYASEKSKEQKSSFNINTKSLKKIYEHAGQVISSMIKNRSLTYNSCKAMSYSAFSESSPQNNLERKVIEDRIKAKFMNIRQKERRNNLKKLLFGQH